MIFVDFRKVFFEKVHLLCICMAILRFLGETLRRKYSGIRFGSFVGWKIELIPQKTSSQTHFLWVRIIVWDVSDFFCIFPAWLKFRFPHCKSGEFWIFLKFGRKPLEGSLMDFVNWKVVSNQCLWWLVHCGIDFCWIWKSFFLKKFICYVYAWRFWDFWLKTLRRKSSGIRFGSFVGWKIELIPQKTSFQTHSLWCRMIVWDVSEFFCIFPAWLKFHFRSVKLANFGFFGNPTGGSFWRALVDFITWKAVWDLSLDVFVCFEIG